MLVGETAETKAILFCPQGDYSLFWAAEEKLIITKWSGEWIAKENCLPQQESYIGKKLHISVALRAEGMAQMLECLHTKWGNPELKPQYYQEREIKRERERRRREGGKEGKKKGREEERKKGREGKK
jgi:hypothetical protein